MFISKYDRLTITGFSLFVTIQELLNFTARKGTK